jgi:hypothetical protein
VRLRPSTRIAAEAYDGHHLPFGDDSYEIVMLSDVLHHADAPTELLGECLRVAARAVALKDHFCFGPISRSVLLAMDHVGNAAPGVPVVGRYWAPPEWLDLVREAGGRMVELRWPVRVHSLPWRLVTRSELQFVALVEAASRSRAPTGNDRAAAGALHGG